MIENWARVPKGSEVDIACSAYGGKILHASNEHYGPAVQILSPFPPLNMFDGFESARSRVPGHTEEGTIGLGRESVIHRIEVEFTYFVNNNPRSLSIQALIKGAWVPIVPKTEVKVFAGNTIAFQLSGSEPMSQLKLTVYPDGGMNRVRAYTRKLT